MGSVSMSLNVKAKIYVYIVYDMIFLEKGRIPNG